MAVEIQPRDRVEIRRVECTSFALMSGAGAVADGHVFQVYDTVTYQDVITRQYYDVAEPAKKALYARDGADIRLIMQAAAPLLDFLKSKHLHKNHPELLEEG